MRLFSIEELIISYVFLGYSGFDYLYGVKNLCIVKGNRCIFGSKWRGESLF